MMNVVNATLNTLGTGLIAFGVTQITQNPDFPWAGIAEVVLGLLAYVVYELTPSAPEKTT